MPLYSNIYQNLAVVQLVTIPSGQTETPTINCAQLSNGSGAGALRRITLPLGFPDGGTLDFYFIENIGDTDFAHSYTSDGVNENTYSLIVPSEVSTNAVSINLLPAAFDSVQIFKMVSSNPMPSDQVIKFIFQPIYQGTA